MKSIEETSFTLTHSQECIERPLKAVNCERIRGPVAQWTTRLTTNQKIAGSSPARIAYNF